MEVGCGCGHDQRVGEAAVKWPSRRTDGLKTAGNAPSSDSCGALICFEAEADGLDDQGKLHRDCGRVSGVA